MLLQHHSSKAIKIDYFSTVNLRRGRIYCSKIGFLHLGFQKRLEMKGRRCLKANTLT